MRDNAMTGGELKAMRNAAQLCQAGLAGRLAAAGLSYITLHTPRPRILAVHQRTISRLEKMAVVAVSVAVEQEIRHLCGDGHNR